MSPRVAVVAGASGMVGRQLSSFLMREGWNVMGLATRRNDSVACPLIEVDLMSPESCRTKLSPLTGTTHIFYAARYPHRASQPEPVAENLAMLCNLVNAIEPAAPGLQHVHLVHGMKIYGCLLGPHKTPTRESDPPTLDENFYLPQQNWIEERQRGKHWTWTASRPQLVCEASVATNRNIILTIATYASICREIGARLTFPGSSENYNAIYQCTHSEMLSKAISYLSTHVQCRNNAFNVTNGDYFRWANLWPRIADWFGLETAPPQNLPLSRLMARKGDVWDRIVKKHSLKKTPNEAMALWPYAEYIFSHAWDMMADTSKLRRVGFFEYMESEEMFLAAFDQLSEEQLIPRRAV